MLTILDDFEYFGFFGVMGKRRVVSSDLGTQGKDKFWSQPLNRQKHIQKSAYELRAKEEQILGDGKRPTRPYVFP